MQEYVSKLYDALVEATSECKANYLSFSGGLDSTIIAYLLKDKIHGVSVIISDHAAPDYTFIEIAREEFNIPVDIEYVNLIKEKNKNKYEFNSITGKSINWEYIEY